jgi:hypothetical protein
MARRSRTGWWALGVSLGLHLLVLLAVNSRLPPLSPPPPPLPLSVEVVHLPPAPTPPPAPAPPAASAPSRTRKRRDAEAPRAPAAPAASTPARAGKPAGEAPRAGLPADAPLAGSGGTLLAPELRVGPPPDDGVRVEGEEGGLHARESKGDVAGNILRESLAQQNVARGSVHAYFGQLRDVLEAVWNVRRVAREGRSKSRIGAQVRLTQGRGGELRAVALLFSSSDDDIDRGLIQDLRAAAHNLPVPPPEVVRGREEFSSVWRFQFMARQKYNAPGAIVTFDVMNLVDKKAIPPPLDKRVELLAAD